MALCETPQGLRFQPSGTPNAVKQDDLPRMVIAALPAIVAGYATLSDNFAHTPLEEISGIQICTTTPSALNLPGPDSSDVQKCWDSI